jgi:hypothetical protein
LALHREKYLSEENYWVPFNLRRRKNQDFNSVHAGLHGYAMQNAMERGNIRLKNVMLFGIGEN